MSRSTPGDTGSRRSPKSARGGIAISDVLLSRAADLGVDMMAAGVNHHSQLRESLLGEVSRDLLDHGTSADVALSVRATTGSRPSGASPQRRVGAAPGLRAARWPPRSRTAPAHRGATVISRVGPRRGAEHYGEAQDHGEPP
jgi:hypothetical protein